MAEPKRTQAKKPDNDADTERQEIISANQELAAANKAQLDEIAALKKQIAEAVPVSFTDRHDSTMIEQPSDGTARMEEDKLINPQRETLDNPAFASKVAYEAFMAEPVEVEIMATSDNGDYQSFNIAVNGLKETFVVGEKKVVKRYFVEGLARAKRDAFSNVETIDKKNRRTYIWPKMTTNRYAFSVTNDRNPNGRGWLDSVMRQQ
jgi:hypothetical protein